MPVSWVVSEDGDFLVFWFSGTVTETDMARAQTETSGLLPRGGEFAALVVFEPGVDLSELDPGTISRLYRQRATQFEASGARRRAGVALVSSSADAQLIVPLWNAMDHVTDNFLGFKICYELQDALDHLGVDPDQAAAVMSARTG